MASTRKTISEDQLSALEAHLAGTLRRVVPPNDVVQRLRTRIRMPQPGEIVSRIREWRIMIVVFGGVMSGMVALLSLARALYYMVSRKNI